MRLAIDWDDTLVDARSQDWLDGAEHALRELHAMGHKLVIHSCRTGWPEGLASIEAKLARHGLTFVTVDTGPGKPAADKYIDNAAITFPGTWSPILAHFRGITNQQQARKLALNPYGLGR